MILILVTLMFIPQIQAKIDPKAAVGIWLFDEGKGKTVSDLSGNSNDGEIMGNPSWEKGKFGTAYSSVSHLIGFRSKIIRPYGYPQHTQLWHGLMLKDTSFPVPNGKA